MNDLRTALNLAVAAEHVPRQADAPPSAPRSASQARMQVLATPCGRTLLRMIAMARRPAQSARKARSGRPPPPGYAPRRPAPAPPPARPPAPAPSPRRPPAPAPSPKKPPAPTPSPKKPAKDPLDFLHDPTLSIEDKLIQLLAYLSAKWDKEIQDKMDQIGASETAKKSSDAKSSGSSGSSGSKKKGGGLLGGLGSIADFIEGVVSPATAALQIPAVADVLKQVGGPVLAAGATALGAPELAPFLLKNGPEIVATASKLASSLEGEGGSGSSGGSGSKPSEGGSKPASGGGKALSDAETQMIFTQIQRIQQKQQEMFGLVSAILKSNHDTRMGVVNNIR